jgi:CelD/BcsL family acetyltransferase involved in cellulose biosynthesis
MMRISLISAHEAPDALWREAEVLQAKCPDRADPLFSPQLARFLAFLRQDTKLITAYSGDELVAFWPVHLRPGGWARPIAGPFSDWHAPLIDPSQDLDAMELLADAGISGITVSAYKPEPGEPLRAGTRTGAHLSVINSDIDTWMEHQRSLHARHFKKTRQKRKHIERDFKSVVYNLDDRSDETFETILRLKRAQYAATGRHDVFSAPWARAFANGLRQHGTPQLHLRVVSLHLDGRFAAGEAMLCSPTVAHGWLTAYDPDFGNYSPGFLIVEEILNDMPSRGQSIYDAGPGQDYYKKYYTNVMTPVDQGVLRTGKIGFTPARLLGSSWRELETRLPARAGQLMGKVRRRSDQILVSEVSSLDRMRGFARAASRGGKA